MRKTVPGLLSGLLAIGLFTWYSCQKNPVKHNPVDPTAEKVTASLQGRVLDENNIPVKDATVKAATSTTTTDVNGIFRFNNIELSKNAGFVTVEKTGYLKGSRTIFTNANTVNNVEIKLIPKIVRGSFSAAAGGNINIQGGSSVNFPASAMINTANNSTYSGTVSVIGAWLDPTDPELSQIMPGNLTGLNTSGEQQLLRTYGMMAIELEGAGGEKLNLATGKTATITMPVPASLQASAPATIPLWFFDETKGLWKEEGTASKQGTNYVGTVSHFSFWNCDVPASFINLKMTLKDQAAQPLAGYKVRLTSVPDNSSADGITDSAGAVSGAVPKNTTMTMDVYDICGNIIHTQTIGPFSTDTDLGTITVSATSIVSVTFNGSVLNCSNAPVTNGFAQINLDGVIHRAVVNSSGNYSITVNKCHPGVSAPMFIGGDLQTGLLGGDTLVMTVISGAYTIPPVRACGSSIAEFVSYNVNGTHVFFASPDSFRVSRSGNSTGISVYPVTQASDFSHFSFSGPAAPGTYALLNTMIYSSGQNYIQNLPSATNTINITEYGSSPGQYISGTLSGTIKDSIVNGSSPMVPFSGTFRVKRDD